MRKANEVFFSEAPMHYARFSANAARYWSIVGLRGAGI